MNSRHSFSRHPFRAFAAAAALLFAHAAHAGSYEDFFAAITRDNPQALQALFERGFDANTVDDKGQTGLYVALRGESLKAAAAIVEAPSLQPNVLNAAGESALMMAALRGQVPLATRLIERGADIEKKGWTPLHYAASGPSTPMVALLLAKGAAIEAPSPNGSTPLMMAAGYGPESSVEALLAKGADAKRVNDLKLSAADFARRAGRETLAKRLEAAAAR